MVKDLSVCPGCERKIKDYSTQCPWCDARIEPKPEKRNLIRPLVRIFLSIAFLGSFIIVERYIINIHRKEIDSIISDLTGKVDFNLVKATYFDVQLRLIFLSLLFVLISALSLLIMARRL